MDQSKLASLIDLRARTLEELGDALRDGSLRHGVSPGLLSPFVGQRAEQISAIFRDLAESGCSNHLLAEICDGFREARQHVEKAHDDVFLTLSGPGVHGVPVVDTATVVRSLFEEAEKDVIVTSYVFHDAAQILEPLAKRYDADPEFKVTFIVDLSHQRKDKDEPLPVIAGRFRKHFREKLWRGTREPKFWHDPRVFDEEDRRKAGVMHAKVVVVDQKAALVTSANFTGAAQTRNIEAGLLLRDSPHVVRLRDFFESLIRNGNLKEVA